MNRKSWKVSELDIVYPSGLTLSYINDDGDTVTKALDNDLLVYSSRRYFDYTFLDYTGSLKANVITANFAKWWGINSERFGRIFRALDEVYNPIENVFKKGHIETTHGHIIDNEDNIAKHKITSKPNTIESSIYERSSDSGTLEVVGKNVSGSASGDTGGISESDSYKDTHKTTNSGKDVVEDTTHGNIGVTKSSELALSEIETVRQINVYDMIIDAFYYDNAYYVDNFDIF